MQITRTDRSGVVCLQLQGRFDEFAIADVEKSFAEVAQEDARCVVLELSGVEYVTSSGLRTLLMLHRAIGNNNGSLKLCGLTPFVAQVFEVSNFSSMFAIYPALDEALRAAG